MQDTVYKLLAPPNRKGVHTLNMFDSARRRFY